MKNVKGSSFKQSLPLNLIAALIASLAMVFLFLQSLDFWTNHGAYLRVPDVKGRKLDDAVRILERQGLDVIIQDSTFNDAVPALQVLKQFPEPEQTVKVNRTVYLTINRATAPLVDMPNLVGMTFRNAELELRARGLRLGDTTFVPDIAKNAVKEQNYRNASIRPGTKIAMGSAISLVLGAGIGNELIPVPDLFGMPYLEAMTLLEANGISLGVVLPDPDVTDTSAGFVYWQNPPRFNEQKKRNMIRMGQMMDVRLSLIKPERTDSIVMPINEPLQ